MTDPPSVIWPAKPYEGIFGPTRENALLAWMGNGRRGEHGETWMYLDTLENQKESIKSLAPTNSRLIEMTIGIIWWHFSLIIGSIDPDRFI